MDQLCVRRRRPTPEPEVPIPTTPHADPFYKAIENETNWKKYAGLNFAHLNGRNGLRKARTLAA